MSKHNGGLTIFQIDAFTDKVFGGNPAAVCPLDEWLDDGVLQAIAAENNLAETAFFVSLERGFHLRWFTPACEVKLCGHATLASAFAIFNELERDRDSVEFETKSGALRVSRASREADALLTMDFPAQHLRLCADPPDDLIKGLRQKPREVYTSDAENYFVFFDSETEVRALRPDFSLLERLHPYGVVASAPGDVSDCASRYFAPGYGIPEDSVTGSIHCGLTTFWAARLGKKRIHARQVSARGGELFCEDKGDRVFISGHAVKYLTGTIAF